EGYITRRLELAGRKFGERPLFSADAIETICQFSQGIPRLVNTLCENSLLLGYGLQMDQIPATVVRGAAADLGLTISLPMGRGAGLPDGQENVHFWPKVSPQEINSTKRPSDTSDSLWPEAKSE